MVGISTIVLIKEMYMRSATQNVKYDSMYCLGVLASTSRYMNCKIIVINRSKRIHNCSLLNGRSLALQPIDARFFRTLLAILIPIFSGYFLSNFTQTFLCLNRPKWMSNCLTEDSHNLAQKRSNLVGRCFFWFKLCFVDGTIDAD